MSGLVLGCIEFAMTVGSPRRAILYIGGNMTLEFVGGMGAENILLLSAPT